VKDITDQLVEGKLNAFKEIWRQPPLNGEYVSIGFLYVDQAGNPEVNTWFNGYALDYKPESWTYNSTRYPKTKGFMDKMNLLDHDKFIPHLDDELKESLFDHFEHYMSTDPWILSLTKSKNNSYEHFKDISALLQKYSTFN
jgi:hypothetical protein